MDQKIVPVAIAQASTNQQSRMTLPEEMEIEKLALGDLGLLESDLEEFVRKHIGVLFEDESLLIVGQQPVNTQLGRADLIAINSEGNLVLIELKRDAQAMARRPEPFETQAIRYAASCATIRTQQDLVQKLFAPYISNHWSEFQGKGRNPTDVATLLLADFLSQTNATRTFNQHQSIVLIASSFDDQTLSGCGWLVQNGIDLRCIQLTVLKHNNQHFLNIEQLLPPPTIDEYLLPFVDPTAIRPRTATTPTSTTTPAQRHATTLRVSDLVHNQLLLPGEQVSIKTRNGISTAVVRADGLVDFNGQAVSYLSWGKQATGWTSVNIYDQVTVDRNGIPTLLGTLRDELAAQQQAAAAAPVSDGEDATALATTTPLSDGNGYSTAKADTMPDAAM